VLTNNFNGLKREFMTTNNKDNISPTAFIASLICSDALTELFETTETKEATFIYHDLVEDILFSVDYFEQNRLENLKQNKNFRFVLSLNTINDKKLTTFGTVFIEKFIEYLKTYDVITNNIYYSPKEATGYFKSDVEWLIQQIKIEIDNLNKDTLKFYQRLLSLETRNKNRSHIVFKLLPNSFENFDAKFFCFRLRTAFKTVSAFQIEILHEIQNYLAGKI